MASIFIKEQTFPGVYIRFIPRQGTTHKEPPAEKVIRKEITIKVEIITGASTKIISAGNLEIEARMGTKSYPSPITVRIL